MNKIKMPSGGNRRLISSFAGNVNMRTDTSVLSEGAAAKIVNFDVSSGALKDGYGLANDVFSDCNALSVWKFTRYDYDNEKYITYNMYCGTDGYVYYNDGQSDEWKKLDNAYFTSPVNAVTYRLYGDDSILITSATDKMLVWDGVNEVRKVENSPYITSVAMHYERMFATTTGERNAVYFSDDLDPTNWNVSDLDEGGFIQLLDERGKLLKVIDFLNYVYIFREYGISRLTAYADQSDFSVVNLYVAGGRIYEGSVCACGDEVMMLSSDGLYTFDGYSATTKLKTLVFQPSPNASAVFSDGKYYLAACLNATDGVNDSLIVYDLTANTFSVSALPVARLCKAGEEVFAITHEGKVGKVTLNGMLFDEPLEKVWESGETDMGSSARKNLVYVCIRSSGEVELNISADDEERSYIIGGGEGIQRVRTNMSGKIFKFKLTSRSPDSSVSRLTYLVRGG